MKTLKALIGTTLASVLLSTTALAQTADSVSNSGAQAGSVSGALNNNSTTNGAQTTTVAPVSNGDSTALSGSNSSATQNQNQFNGGNTVGPIDSSVRVGPSTSTSDSDSNSISGSNSVSRGGDGGSGVSSATSAGGNSTSDAQGGTATAEGGAATGGTSSSNQSQNAQNAGNQQNINFNSTTPKKTKLETLPQVYAPALTTTLTETCMGSTSGGVSVMGFGGTLGTTWNDKQCVRRLNAREMAQTLGDRDAARALMCQDADVAAAYAAVGQSCTTPPVQVVMQAPPQPAAQYSAPPPSDPPHGMAPVPNPPEPQKYKHPRGD